MLAASDNARLRASPSGALVSKNNGRFPEESSAARVTGENMRAFGVSGATSPADGAVNEHIYHVAALSSALLRNCGGEVARQVPSIRTSFFTPHIDVPRDLHYFGEVEGFPQISRLLRVLPLGAPVDVTPGGNLQAYLAYGNHHSAALHVSTIRAKIGQDAIDGRAIVLERTFAPAPLASRKIGSFVSSTT